MNKQELKTLRKDLERNCISLTKFLVSYCGIYNEEIYSAKISHHDVKELMPHIKRVSFDSLLENKDSFYTGDIIPVKDCHGNVVPYINPMLENDFQFDVICEIEKEAEFENIIITENMSKYELSELCKKYKEHNMQKEYRMAYRMLKTKKEPKVKQYKKRKDNLIMKGRSLNEEY